MKRKNYFKTFSVFFMLMLLSIGCQPESGSESESAKKLIALGLSQDQIASVTGLSIEEIEKL